MTNAMLETAGRTLGEELNCLESVFGPDTQGLPELLSHYGEIVDELQQIAATATGSEADKNQMVNRLVMERLRSDVIDGRCNKAIPKTDRIDLFREHRLSAFRTARFGFLWHATELYFRRTNVRVP